MEAKRIAVLASGRGSNFEALVTGIRSGKIQNAKMSVLICNRKEAPVLEKARQFDVPTHLVETNTFRKNGKIDRNAYERSLLETLRAYAPDFICLAGYMLLLGPTLLNAYPFRILNIHPSLLPEFPGLKAQLQALRAGVKETGCTVHFVTEEMDGGPIIAQQSIKIDSRDTVQSLSTKLLPVEHQTYVEALQRVCNEPFQVEGNEVRWR